METSELIGLVLGSTVVSNLIGQLIEIFKNKKGHLGRIEKKLDEHIRLDDERNAVQCRVRIIRFCNDLQNGQTFTLEYYRQVEEDIRIYDNFCEAHPDFRNAVTTESTKYIKANFDQLFAAGAFNTTPGSSN